MRTNNSPLVVITLMIVSIISVGLPAQGQNTTGTRISGAGLLSDVVESFHEEFVKTNPTCGVTVLGATTGIGFKKLIDGEVEMAMMTRKVTPEEAKLAEAKGVSLSSKFVGKIGLAVITSSTNKVNELTMDQLAKIFKGEITNWSLVGGPNEPIKVTIRAVPETGAGVLFQEVVLKGAPYSKDAQVMNSYGTTVKVCEKSSGIGYIPTTTIYFGKLAERGLKMLKIKKDENTEPYKLTNGVARESMYPISVDFILYWNSKLENPCTKGFADFCEKLAQ